ncbi:MAG TPA: putative Ig domain-containing protein [Steroidobacter sp.]
MPSPGGGDGGNGAPTISGQPGTTVAVGEAYSFQPSANDPDGDDLTFSIENAPSWTSFDASTGRLSGTPGEEDIATYEGITITVSDGSQSATLGPFSITVTEMGTGTATVSWTPPTTNTDGSALTDLSGFEVRYGRSESDLSRTVEIDNPSVNRYVIENLTSGTWYFAVAAVNRAGVAGPLSNVGSKTIS